MFRHVRSSQQPSPQRSGWRQALWVTAALAFFPATFAPAETPSAADASGDNPEVQSERLLQRLRRVGLGEEISKQLSRVLRENLEKVKKGELPNKPMFLVKVRFSSELAGDPAGQGGDPAKVSARLDFLADGLGKAPRQDEKMLGLPERVTPENYPGYVHLVFDVTGLHAWKENPDGTPRTEVQKRRDIEDYQDDEAKFRARYEELRKGPSGEQAAALFLGLINQAKAQLDPTCKTRETYRRLLVAAAGIAWYTHQATPAERDSAISLTTNQAGEYVALTQGYLLPNANKDIAKPFLGNLKYILPADHSLQEAFAGFADAQSVLKDIPPKMLHKIQADNERLDRLAQKQFSLTKTEAEIAGTKAEIAETKAEIARKEENIARNKKLIALSKELEGLVEDYLRNPSSDKKKAIIACAENKIKPLNMEFDTIMNQTEKQLQDPGLSLETKELIRKDQDGYRRSLALVAEINKLYANVASRFASTGSGKH